MEDVSSSSFKGITRKQRANTWSDSELEELYDIKSMNPASATKTRHLLQMMKAIRHCNKAKKLESAIEVIVESTCEILGCDRATLFIVDEITEELVIRQAVGIEDIRIPLDKNSIAGTVYHSMEKLNIGDAYADPRFNKSADEQSGYKTVSILCTPIWDANYEPVAVLQAVNKIASDDKNTKIVKKKSSSSADRYHSIGGRLFNKKTKDVKPPLPPKEDDDSSSSAAGFNPENVVDPNMKFCAFTTEDEVLMDHLSLQLGVILRNQMLREASERAHEQVVSLLDIVRSLHSKMGINSLMFTITERSPGLVDADRCTLYVVDRKHEELWSLQGALEIRVPLDKGLVGSCASTGEIINIDDAHKDPRFNTEFDKKTGFRTKSVLVMPIRDNTINADHSSSSSVIGVLQVINKLHGPRFTDEDEQLLGSFLDIVGSLLMTSQLFNTSHQPETEFGAAQDIATTVSPSKRAASHQQTPQLSFFPEIIEEDEEEEDEEQ